MQKKLSVFQSISKYLPWVSALIFATLNSYYSAGQGHEILESFSLTQTGNNVLVNFAIKGGASCNGVTLQRRLSSDSIYSVAAEIQGVCGGSEFTEHYTLEDDSPELGNSNIYRLKLGTVGFSDELEITVIELLSEYTIYPQPAASEVFLKYDNPGNTPVSVNVFDSAGRIVKRLRGLTSDLIFINSSDLEVGMYIFQLEFSTGEMLTGKFIRTQS